MTTPDSFPTDAASDAFYARLDDLLDRRIRPETDAEFRAELARNPAWQSLWQAEQALFAGLRATAGAGSVPNLTDRILAELAAEPVTVATEPARRSRWGIWALCGTLAAAVLVVLIPALRTGPAVPAPNQIAQQPTPEKVVPAVPVQPAATQQPETMVAETTQPPVPLADLLREAQTRTYALASETQSEWSELAVLIPSVAVPTTGDALHGKPGKQPWLDGMQRPLEPFQNRVQSAFDFLLDTLPGTTDRAAS